MHGPAGDPTVGAVVVNSALDDFWIAHSDVSRILRFPTDLPPAHELGLFTRVCEHFRSMPKLTIAVTDGRVGGEAANWPCRSTCGMYSTGLSSTDPR